MATSQQFDALDGLKITGGLEVGGNVAIDSDTLFIDALNEIKTEGLINTIGASNWELDRFSSARDYALKNNKEPFSVLSNNFSLAQMIEPVWPGCVAVSNEFLDYINKNEIKLFPWSSTARGFFIRKKEIVTKEHFSNPSLEEEKRVWHSRKNLKRRDICFEIAEKKNYHLKLRK